MIRSCEKCGQKNRVPAARLSREARCGACKATLSPLSVPVNVDSAEFDEIVNHVSVPVLVDFWAEWCAPCRMASPHVEAVAREMSGRAIVLKVVTEAEPGLASRFQIRGIPNFMVLKGGSVVLQEAGLVDSAKLRSWLEQAGA